MAGIPRDHDLLFAHDFPPMGGGISRWMAALAAGYPPGGLLISTGSIAGGAASDATMTQHIDRVPVPVERLKTVGGLRVWSNRAVSLADDPAARFSWCDTIRPAAYPAHWAFRRTGLPYGIMVVGNDVLTLRAKIARSRFKRRIMRAVIGNASVVVAISEWTAAQCRHLLSDLALDSSGPPLRVVPLGTDPARWRVVPDAAKVFRRQRGLPDGRWLVTVARLVEYKGIDTAIRLVGALGDSHPDLQYAVVGRGPDEARLRRIAADAGIADRIHILTDVADVDLPAAYSMGDVYVGLTRETAFDVEGFGISFAEAAACGLPVVATRSGGIPDAVVDGETGALFNEADTVGMQAAVRGFLDDPARARRVGAAGRERVERYLNWDRVVTEMRAIAAEFARTEAPRSPKSSGSAR